MNRKVSIITPVFNRLKELTRLYETLNNQTNDNFIWIIIDDGSEKPIDKVVNTWKKNQNLRLSLLFNLITEKCMHIKML